MALSHLTSNWFASLSWGKKNPSLLNVIANDTNLSEDTNYLHEFSIIIRSGFAGLAKNLSLDAGQRVELIFKQTCRVVTRSLGRYLLLAGATLVSPAVVVKI